MLLDVPSSVNLWSIHAYHQGLWHAPQGETPQGLPEKQPAEEQNGRRRGGAGPSGQNGQAEWVARGGSGKGSKHHGVDPVVPFTDTAQLQVRFSALWKLTKASKCCCSESSIVITIEWL